MLPKTPLHWLSSVEVGAEFGVEQLKRNKCESYSTGLALSPELCQSIWIKLS